MAFLDHYACRISILPLRYLFYLISYYITFFLARRVETSRTKRVPITIIIVLNRRAAAYVFAPTGVITYYFYLLIMALTTLVNLVMWTLSIMTRVIFRDFDIFNLSFY